MSFHVNLGVGRFRVLVCCFLLLSSFFLFLLFLLLLSLFVFLPPSLLILIAILASLVAVSAGGLLKDGGLGPCAGREDTRQQVRTRSFNSIAGMNSTTDNQNRDFAGSYSKAIYRNYSQATKQMVS